MPVDSKERRVPDNSATVAYSHAGGWAEHQAALSYHNPAPDASAPASPSGQTRSITVEVGVRVVHA